MNAVRKEYVEAHSTGNARRAYHQDAEVGGEGCLLRRGICPLLIWSDGGTGRRRKQWYSLCIATAGIVQTKVQKWGNSLGVRIPRGLAEEVGLGAGTEVSLTVKDGELVLRPSVPSRLNLGDLLAGVTPENIHAFVDTGDAVGAEAF